MKRSRWFKQDEINHLSLSMIMTMNMKSRAYAIVAAILLSAWTITLSAQEETEPAAPPMNDWRQVLAESLIPRKTFI